MERRRGIVKLKILDNEWIFDFGMPGWTRVEALTGKSMDDCIAQIKGNATMLSYIVQGTLQRYHPNITLDEAGDLATESGDEIIAAAVASLAREGKDDRPTSSLKAAS